MLIDRKWYRHAEVVVGASLTLAVLVVGSSLHEVEKVGRSSHDVVSLDAILLRHIIVGECLVDRIVSLGRITLVVGGGINQEILGHTILHDEAVESGGIVVHLWVEDALACGVVTRLVADALGHVVRTGEVDGGEGWGMYIRIVRDVVLAVGIVVECVELGVAIVGGGAIHSVGHVVDLL